MADVDLLLATQKPHVYILTGVGSTTRNRPTFPRYTGVAQVGTNAYGGVAILHQNDLKCKVIDKDKNDLLTELKTVQETVLVGVVYVPPGCLPPFQLFNRCRDKPFCLFGDYNAKHTSWGCKKNDPSGIHIFEWPEATGWTSEVLEGRKNIGPLAGVVLLFVDDERRTCLSSSGLGLFHFLSRDGAPVLALTRLQSRYRLILHTILLISQRPTRSL